MVQVQRLDGAAASREECVKTGGLDREIPENGAT
jgi:hypothetical protein